MSGIYKYVNRLMIVYLPVAFTNCCFNWLRVLGFLV